MSEGTPNIRVGLLTGGKDPHYSFGLTMALATQGVAVDVVGSDGIENPAFRRVSSVRFLNLRGDQSPHASLPEKVTRIAVYYGRLIRYAFVADPKIFHILWNNKFEAVDRTLLMLYYRMVGRKVAFTAHNVNAGRRDSKNSWLNRLTLMLQYRLSNHIFVHTDRMKQELVEEFAVREAKITVIPYGINNAVPDTDLTPLDVRRRLGIGEAERTILFFGRIAPYKGLDYLITAVERLLATDQTYRLIVAGQVKEGAERYWEGLRHRLEALVSKGRATVELQHIADDKAEVYFKAADVLVLPYREIFQSGVLFFGYSFGVPAIVADVGALREDVVEGRTGFVCKPNDPEHLVETIERYFESELFNDIDRRRQDIRTYTAARHSWETVAELTRDVYLRLLDGTSREAGRPSSALTESDGSKGLITRR
jgi:D-inositol-3-phosphate glycosyltransferase